MTLGAYAHQDVPFEKLVDELQPDRTSGRTPLFQVIFAWQNAPEAVLDLGTSKLEPFRIEGTTAKFELTLALWESGGELQGVLEYNTDLFDSSTIANFLQRFQRLLEGVVKDPGRCISEYGC